MGRTLNRRKGSPSSGTRKASLPWPTGSLPLRACEWGEGRVGGSPEPAKSPSRAQSKTPRIRTNGDNLNSHPRPRARRAQRSKRRVEDPGTRTAPQNDPARVAHKTPKIHGRSEAFPLRACEWGQGIGVKIG